ncbi:hypothetical protein BGZ46_010657 [Entomortierella lignicola]|nr:hypothetical protein BGZ46_010657 [Entomortierella lignicola]
MSSSLTIPFVIIGASLFIALFVAFVTHKSRQARKKILLDYEQREQQRMQQVTDLNLPPFYNDHGHDPICVYDDEIRAPTTALCKNSPGSPSPQINFMSGASPLETIRVESMGELGTRGVSSVIIIPSPALDRRHNPQISSPQPPPPSYQSTQSTRRSSKQ